MESLPQEDFYQLHGLWIHYENVKKGTVPFFTFCP